MEDINKLRKDFEEAKRKLNEAEKEASRRDNAIQYFEEFFELDMISDNYNIYPQEIFFNIRCKFADKFSGDGTNVDDKLLEEVRKDYINTIQMEIIELQEEFNKVKQQYNKLK